MTAARRDEDMMEPIDLTRLLTDAAETKAADDVVVLDVEALVGYASYFVICSARSGRQVQAIADHVVRHLRTEYGYRPLGTDGVGIKAHWAVLDYGDVVMHVFRDAERALYDLEGLWQDAPRVELEQAS